MNEVTRRTGSSAVAALSNLKAGLTNVVQTIATTGSDPYLRLLKDGSWVYGAENVEVEDKSEWAINPLSLKHGFCAWTDYKKKANEKMGEVMVPAFVPLPDRGTLQDVKDENGEACRWDQQLSLQLQCLTLEDTGVQVQYNTTSVGGMNAVAKLIEAILKQLETDEANPVPVVIMGSSSYQHKTYGKTYVPEFEIVDWVPLDENIKAPIGNADTPDSDTKTEQAQAEQVRSRGGEAGRTSGDAREPTRAASQTEITDADRRAALDGAMADLANERASQSAGEEAAPRRRTRR